jgi:hypothetical protein
MSRLTFIERARRHDIEIAAIRELVLTARRIMVDIEKGITDLQAAQKRSEQTLERFIRSRERGWRIQ